MGEGLSDREVVKQECVEMINDPCRSNFVKVPELADRKKIQMHFSHRYKTHGEGYQNEGGGVNIAVGNILTEVNWASKLSAKVYMIDESEL